MLKENNSEENIVFDDFTSNMVNAIKTAKDSLENREYDVEKICSLLTKALDGYLFIFSKDNLRNKKIPDVLITNLVQLWWAYSENIFMISYCIGSADKVNAVHLKKVIFKTTAILTKILKMARLKHNVNFVKEQIIKQNVLLAEICLTEKSYHEVIHFTYRALEISYTFTKPYSGKFLKSLRSILLTCMGKAQIKLGWKDVGVKCLDNAEKIDDGKMGHELLSVAYFEAALAYEEARSYETAIYYLLKAKMVFNKIPSTKYETLSKSCVEIHDCDKRIPELKRAHYNFIKQEILKRIPNQYQLGFEDSQKIICFRLDKSLHKRFLKKLRFPYEVKENIIYFKELHQYSANIIINNITLLIHKITSIQPINKVEYETAMCSLPKQEIKANAEFISKDEKINELKIEKTKTKTKSNVMAVKKESPESHIHQNNFFGEAYKSKEIYTLSNDHIPAGIYFGFFEPKNLEVVSKAEAKHHCDILKRGKIVSGQGAQGVKFVKIKQNGKENTFKTKDPSHDIRCVADLVQVIEDEEHRKRFLYQFGTFTKHT